MAAILSASNTTEIQAKLDDAEETANIELDDATLAPVVIPMQKRRVTISVPAGKTVQWDGAGQPVLTRTDDTVNANVRLIAAGDLRTDCEGTVSGEDARGAPTYSVEPTEAITLEGIDELVILGRGEGHEKNTFRGAYSIKGSTLKRYLEQNAETIYIRRRDDGAPIGGAVQKAENQRIRDRKYVPAEWEE